MKKSISKVLFLKVGEVKVTILENKKKELVSGIKKYPISEAYLTKIGFKNDFQADLKHHGGENKAIFMLSKLTYEKINKELNSDFKYDGVAHFGENIVFDNICEEDICVGDIYFLGDTKIQITQPRQPCWKLSANTNIKEMTKFIFNSGLTGWYAKVLEEGMVKQNDDFILEQRFEPDFKISTLNRLILNPLENKNITQKAINSELLGRAFKKSLEKRFLLRDKDTQFDNYHS